MTSLNLELAIAPGHSVEDAVSALASVGLRVPQGYQAIPMKGRATTYVVAVNDPSGDAEEHLDVLSGIAQVVAVYGDPTIGPVEKIRLGF